MTEVVRLRQMILRFLATDSLELLAGAEEDVWRRTLRWLDRSGLALPLAARLEALPPSACVPAGVRTALKSRLLDNQKRMERMLEFFRETTRALSVAGARYCCVKGFSMVPDCFDGIRERHQVDLDFLVAPEDLKPAQQAIESLGYGVQYASSSGEVRLIKPWRKHIGVNGYLYQLPEAPPVELHTRVWECDYDEIEFPSLVMFDDTEVHEVCGVEFPRLRPAQQFVYLLLHIFRHLLGSWTRLLSLYEVATLIRGRSSDDELWAEVGQLIGKDRRLNSACALVLGLVDCAFPQDLPETLREIYAGNLSSDSALWIDRWATAWLLAYPPGNKLNLLVQQQFFPDSDLWR
ncbi:MAG TPA: nucleotidyltransferase family protein, partial [Silvibacterium sp.]|nr:nucleotidyltransferase family protein [Silvibacterium sp.]